MNKKFSDKKAREGSKKNAESNKRRKLLNSKEYAEKKRKDYLERLHKKEAVIYWNKFNKAVETGDMNELFKEYDEPLEEYYNNLNYYGRFLK